MIHSVSLAVPYQTQFSNGRHSGIADVPPEKGGNDAGFGPHELLEAALATCMTMTAQMYAKKYELPLTGVSCEVRIDRSVPGRVTLYYTLQPQGPLSEEQITQIREAVGRCPVGKTLTGEVILQHNS